MSESIDLFNPIEISESTSTLESSELNWKASLKKSLCKNQNEISVERDWATLSATMRSLCPETTWITICENKFDTENNKFPQITNWLSSLIAVPEWPFPEKVLITSSFDGDVSTLRIIFLNIQSNLPYMTPPSGLLVTPWKDKYSTGWEIKNIDSYIINKSGEA